MTLLVSWSIAFDTIISISWTFKSQILPESLDSFNMSLFVPVLRREEGGTAGNISYNLGLLNTPVDIIASVWDDCWKYLEKLEHLWIDTSMVIHIPNQYSPQWYIMSDELWRQITAFHPGAMNFSWDACIKHANYSHALIAPDSKNGIITRMEECKKYGIFSIFDPGQAMWLFSKDELIWMTKQAEITIMNEYERELYKKITHGDFVEICTQFWRIAILTLWEKWSQIFKDNQINHVSAISTTKVVDATGCGDALRAWLLYGLSKDWTLIKSIQLWTILAGIKIWHIWWQNHFFTKEDIELIWKNEFNQKFFD